MFQPGKMHANLMCAAGSQFDIQQSEAIESFPHAIQAQSRAAAPHDRHPCAMTWITSDRLIDLSAILFEPSMDQRNIRLENFTRAKLISEIIVRAFRFRD